MLQERFGDLGASSAERLRLWCSGKIPLACPEILEKHLQEENLDLLFDSFWQVLPFGTGGRRGRVGYGSNRLNPTTVAMTVQGHCEYLLRTFPEGTDRVVVVANDVRVFRDIGQTYRFLGEDHPLLGVSSRSLGRLACEIYAGNGIVAFFNDPGNPDAVLTTPELSFLIGELNAVGGINLSASHNPPDDNGTKVYDQFGSQPVAPADQHLIDAMEKASDIQSISFDQALEEGLIRPVPKGLHDKYVRTYLDLYQSVHVPTDESIGYTPLCGCGMTTVGDVLPRLGFTLVVPPDQKDPDGGFSVIPFKAPNPEVPQSTEPARLFADQKGSSIVLSSDPDADRVGMEIKLADGSWYHFDGNQIAAVLCYFLMLDPRGPRRRGLVIETLVTTKILGKIVEEAGDSWLIDDLLVGFKYVADVLKSLDSTGRYGDISCRPDDLVLATEESHGVVMIPSILDKDATPACMYLAALHQILAAEGGTLLDYYIRILEQLGGFDTVNRSIMMSGASGMLQKDTIMASLRNDPPRVFAGQKVRRIVDYWDSEKFGPFRSESDKMPRNVIQMFTDSFIITVRPSGTEPKLKLYCQLLPPGEGATTTGEELLNEVRRKADDVARRAYNELLSKLDLSLGEAGLLLPDIVELGLKQRFEQETLQSLRGYLLNSTFENLDELLNWLRREAAAMTPGSDPLPALKDPIALVCEEWEDVKSPLKQKLYEWAVPAH